MRRKLGFTLITLLIALLAVQDAPVLSAQAALPAPEQLDQLLSPVALYPDALLSQIVTASTNPQEILDVEAWLQENAGLEGSALTDAAEKQGFDPAFIALVNFPSVLAMMAQNIDDYAAIGQAFSADQGSVTASIQRLRAQAYDAGTLRTNQQQSVDVQQSAGQTVYVIQPANPTVVYVPVYDPTLVYVRPVPGAMVATPLISFNVGIGIGTLLVDNRPWGWGGWGWNWGARRAYYNHGYWGGWSNPYHPPHFRYRPRPIVWANRPGYRGNWGYRPPHYRPPSRPVVRPGHPGNGPGGRPPSPNKPGAPGKPVRPNPTKPMPDRPNKPEKPSQPDRNHPRPSRPGTPEGNNPARPDRPSGQPNRPEKPSQPDRGQPRPSRPGTPDANKPARPDRPSGQPNKPDKPSQPDRGQPRPSRPGTPDANKPARPDRPSRQPKEPESPQHPDSGQPKPQG